MLLIWGIAFIYLVLGHLFQNHFADTHILTFSFIILTMLIFYFVLFMQYTKFIIPLFLGFLVRVGMLLVDLADGGPEIPHSGDDTENFYKMGVLISEKMDLLGESVYGGTYSKLIGVILNIYGDDRLFLQYLNVLFAMTAILVAIQIFRMLDVPARTQFILVAVMAFFPHSLIFSSILLRESIISLMVVLSLYWFVRWFIKRADRCSAQHRFCPGWSGIPLGGHRHTDRLPVRFCILSAFRARVQVHRHFCGPIYFICGADGLCPDFPGRRVGTADIQ
ncbi:hypothetical protein [Salinicoccus sp. CNSTN-B1]